jgi:LmbE family N-acetylglucosaminyl deacetylase
LLDDIIRLRDNIRPDYVFMPSVNDIHQDHYTLAQEGVRAFKFSSLLCYELPWNNFSFQTSCFYEVDAAQLQRKIDAVACYRSQQHRPYASADFIRSLAVTRGVQTGAPLAECFEVVRLVNRLF